MSAKAVAIFEGDDSKLQNTLRHINEGLLGVEERFARVHEFALNVLEAIGLLTVAEKGFEGVKSVLEVGDHLNSLSQQTGVAVGDLAVMEQQFKQSSLAAADIAGAVGHMQRNLSNGSGNAMLAQMGVELNELQKKSPAEQFKELGHAINGLKSPTDRAAAATALFGKEGAALLPVFASHGFEEAAERVGAQAGILNQDAGFFGDASAKLNLAGLKTQGFFVGFADRVVPVLLPLLDRFEKLDLARFGQASGDVVNSFVEAENPFEHWLTAFLAGSVVIIKFIVDALYSGLRDVADALLTAAATFSAIIGRAVADMLDEFAKAPGLGFLHGAASATRGRSANADAASKTFAADIGWHETGLFDGIQQSLGNALTASSDAVLANAAIARHAARKAHPTNAPGEGGLPELGSFGDQGNFSALARIGGNFGGGGGGGDALLDATRDQTDVLREIRDSLKPADPHGVQPQTTPKYR